MQARNCEKVTCLQVRPRGQEPTDKWAISCCCGGLLSPDELRVCAHVAAYIRGLPEESQSVEHSPDLFGVGKYDIVTFLMRLSKVLSTYPRGSRSQTLQ